jgi:hypothetical protein
MADYTLAYKYMIKDEFSNPQNFLHKNEGESDITLSGLYRKWYPRAISWEFVDRVIFMCNGDLEIASKLLYRYKKLHQELFMAFRIKFWDSNKLDLVNDQTIANKMFSSAVNLGNKKASIIAQKVAKVKEDGVIGSITISAINEMNNTDFINLYIRELKLYYDSLIDKNANLAIFRNGWYNRAERIS